MVATSLVASNYTRFTFGFQQVFMQIPKLPSRIPDNSSKGGELNVVVLPLLVREPGVFAFDMRYFARCFARCRNLEIWKGFVLICLKKPMS